MRIDADRERTIFWFMFDKALTENGEPFTITYESGEERKTLSWCAVNNSNPMADKILSINFSVQKKEAYIGINIRDDLDFYSRLLKNKEDIENIIGNYITWERGKRNPNTRSIRITKYIEPGNYRDYQVIIDKFIPIVPKFIEVLNKYGEGKFFK